MNRCFGAACTLMLAFSLWNAPADAGVPAEIGVPTDLSRELPQMLFSADGPGGDAAADSVSGRAFQEFLFGGLDHHQGGQDSALEHYRAAWQRSPSPDIELAIGWAHFEAGRVDSATIYAQRAQLGLPDLLDPTILLSRCYLQTGEPGPAIEALTRGLEIEPHHHWTFVNLLGLLQKTGRIEDALALVEPAIPENLASAHLHVRRAGLRLQMNRADDAIDDMVVALQKDPEYPGLEKRLLQTLGRLSSPERAAPLLEELLRKQPGLQRVRQARVAMLATSGDWKEAMPLLQAQIDAHPEDPRARFQAGLLLMRANQLDPAEEHLLAAAALSPEDSDPYRWLWRVAEGRSDWTQARSWADSILVRTPNDPEGLWFLGVSLFELEQIGESVHTLELLLGQMPRHREASFLLTGIHSLAGRLGLASEVLGRYLEVEPRDEEALFRSGILQEQRGLIEEALATLGRLITVNPDHHRALNYWGYICIERGQKLDEAMSRVERALELDPENPAYLDSYGWGFYQLGRPREAVRHLENALSQGRENWVMLKHLGLSLEQAGEVGKARAVLHEALTLEPGDKELLDAVKRVTDTD